MQLKSSVMKLLLITIVLLAFSFAGIAIKIWAKKDGEFEGTCAGGNARLRAEGISCGCGGGSCQNKDEGHDHDHEETHESIPQIQVKKIS